MCVYVCIYYIYVLFSAVNLLKCVCIYVCIYVYMH